MQSQGKVLKALDMSNDTPNATSPRKTASSANDLTRRTASIVDRPSLKPNCESVRSGPVSRRFPEAGSYDPFQEFARLIKKADGAVG